ncbi:alpha/beta fold hydrolase [Advenella sp. WQ 585]|uniref:Alpha/beta fold hydrolase n=1 Tax=Advenella mandrilli TaxID=2800330 RepID=A0ABS1EDP4_9BURK|nr:alpha/beta fold hydrolase [Advenella mandrilli]MBK1782032.1 alpha/beta fold hydrolase [Advenella mandrilli]
MNTQLDLSACPSPKWLPDGQSQTIFAARFVPRPKIVYARERITTTDNDFIDIDWNIPGLHPLAPDNDRPAAPTVFQQEPLTPPPLPGTQPALILFHGLEGSSQSHYARAICHYFRQKNWVVAVAHFRGCSGEPNKLPRSYFSGDSADIDTIFHHVRQRLPNARWHACGISMGGNALLKYTGEQQESLGWLQAVAGISVPLDLLATGQQLETGFFGRFVYTPHFLQTMKKKIREKDRQFPNAINIHKILQAKTLFDFDDAYTGPVHGFKGALDYWTRCSSKPFLKDIRIPALVLNARNDPFIPETSLPGIKDVSTYVTLHQPKTGGHAGFSTGPFPSSFEWLPHRLEKFFCQGC